MSVPNLKYDIFISYAREDKAWVRDHLYERLCRCRLRKDGRKPRVFFDIGEDGISIGQNWVDAILQAIRESPRVVPVYSANYFRKDMCKFELTKALECDFLSKERKLNPILLDPQVAGQVPFAVSQINYWTVTEHDWFERLCNALELTPEAEPARLDFVDQPTDISVNHTLPVLRVAVKAKGKDAVLPRDELVTLTSEDGSLQGTLAVRAERGVASFTDLSLRTPIASTRLVATAEGLDTGRSRAFAVLNPTTPQARVAAAIPYPGEALFFAQGRALAVFAAGVLRVYRVSAENPLPLLAEVPLVGKVRVARRQGGLLALADWSGNVHLLDAEGRYRSWSFGSQQGGFVVPGDLAFDGPRLYVGFWSGPVWRLGFESEPVRELTHDLGVQGLAVVGDRLYVCGFDGNLWVYRPGGHKVTASALEPAIWLLKAYPRGLLAIGDQKMYHVRLQPMEVFSQPLPIAGTAGVLADVELPVIMDARGSGICLTAELVKRASFHTQAGAVPLDADQTGHHCVLLNPDGSRSLLVQGRVVFTHAAGTLAVAPTGDRFALGDDGGIQILEARAFQQLLKGADRPAARK